MEINELGLWGNYSIPKDNPYVDDKINKTHKRLSKPKDMQIRLNSTLLYGFLRQI